MRENQVIIKRKIDTGERNILGMRKKRVVYEPVNVIGKRCISVESDTITCLLVRDDDNNEFEVEKYWYMVNDIHSL